jgi:hypothetical protein
MIMKKVIEESFVNEVLNLIESGVYQVPYKEVTEIIDRLMDLRESREDELKAEVQELSEMLLSLDKEEK